MKKKKFVYLIPIVVIAVITISFLIPAEALLKNFTFTGAGVLEGFAFTDPATCNRGGFAGSHDNSDGNPIGSILSAYSRAQQGGGGGANCDGFWEWTGTWEDLGATPGDDIDGIDGKFEYLVPVTSVDDWAVGPMELRQSTGVGNCGALTETLELRGPATSGTQLSWTTVDNIKTQHLATQTSSNNICIRMTNHVTTTSGNQANEVNFDNIMLNINNICSTDPNARQPQSTGGFISNGWIKLSDYDPKKP